MTDTVPRGRPADRIAAARRRWGAREVALRAADLLSGTASGFDPELLPYLGGPGALALVGTGPVHEYWARVWGARALLYAWDDAASPAVVSALADPAWRVREMAAKVAARRDLGAAGDALATLAHDPVPRVRAAAARALGVVGEAEHAPALRESLDDDEDAVRRAAERALALMAERLDRDVTGD